MLIYRHLNNVIDTSKTEISITLFITISHYTLSDTAYHCWNTCDSSNEAHLNLDRMYPKLHRDVSGAASWRVCYHVGTYQMLRRDAISTASGEIYGKRNEIDKYATFAQIFCLIYIILRIPIGINRNFATNKQNILILEYEEDILYTRCPTGNRKYVCPGWPANHSGVMLQGFYWDSFSDSKWTHLEAQASELGQYFNLVWIPQSANCGGKSMGYDDLYWFSNYESSFGSESELRSLIKTFKNNASEPSPTW